MKLKEFLSARRDFSFCCPADKSQPLAASDTFKRQQKGFMDHSHRRKYVNLLKIPGASSQVRIKTPDNQDRIKKVDVENLVSCKVKELDHVETELKLSKTRKIP